jgi:hypothetical protein
MDAPPHSNLRMLRCEVIYVSITYKVQASKPSGYRFGLSRNVSIFNLNQYCKLHIEFLHIDFLHPLQYTLYNPLQHPPLQFGLDSGGKPGGIHAAMTKEMSRMLKLQGKDPLKHKRDEGGLKGAHVYVSGVY